MDLPALRCGPGERYLSESQVRAVADNLNESLDDVISSDIHKDSYCMAFRPPIRQDLSSGFCDKTNRGSNKHTRQRQKRKKEREDIH